MTYYDNIGAPSQSEDPINNVDAKGPERIEAEFDACVELLSRKYKTIHASEERGAEASAGIVKAYASFGNTLATATATAEKLDGNRIGVHSASIKQAISEFDGNEGEAVWSMYLGIGDNQEWFDRNAFHVPPYRSSLYEISLARKAGCPVDEWIEEGKLNPKTSFREIKGLREKNSWDDNNEPIKRPNNGITLYPSGGTFLATAQEFKEFLLKTNVRIKQSKQLQLALQELLGAEYESLKSRFI